MKCMFYQSDLDVGVLILLINICTFFLQINQNTITKVTIGSSIKFKAPAELQESANIPITITIGMSLALNQPNSKNIFKISDNTGASRLSLSFQSSTQFRFSSNKCNLDFN